MLVSTALVIASACGPSAEQNGEMMEPGIHSITLDNGAKVFIAADDRSPTITIAARLIAGSAVERPAEEGYSSLLGQMLADSGEGSAAATMASLGTSLTIDVQTDAIYLSVTCLEEDAEVCAKTMLDLIADPVGKSEHLSSKRDELVAALSAARTTAGANIRDLSNAIIYGDCATGASLDERIASLQSLTAESFAAFLARLVRPDETTFALAGSVKTPFFEQFKATALEWKGSATGEKEEEEEKGFEALERKPILIVDQPGDDAAFLMMRRIPAVEPEQYYRVQAVNFILNGQSTYARLAALQVELKLNEAITSTIDLRGKLSNQVITARSPVSSADLFFGNLLSQLQTLYNGKVMDTRLLEQEVADARNFLRGQLLRNTESGYQKAYLMLWADGYGFSSVDPQYHLNLINGITNENLLEVIESHFQPVGYTLVVLGPANVLRTRFGSFGEIGVVGSAN